MICDKCKMIYDGDSSQTHMITVGLIAADYQMVVAQRDCTIAELKSELAEAKHIAIGLQVFLDDATREVGILRALLERLEYGSDGRCPVCRWLRGVGHAPNCWLLG